MIAIQILQYDCLHSIYKIYRNNENLTLNYRYLRFKIFYEGEN